jgi:hypothetical protein
MGWGLVPKIGLLNAARPSRHFATHTRSIEEYGQVFGKVSHNYELSIDFTVVASILNLCLILSKRLMQVITLHTE